MEATPLERAVTRVGDRWTLLIVNALLGGPRRFGELAEALPGIAPNILTARLRRLTDDRLVVAAWGETTESGETTTPGHLKTVDYGSKTVRSLGDGSPVGNLDGVEAIGNGAYLVTDWIAGALFRIDASGKAERLLDLNQGSADLEYVAADGLALVPMMMDGTVVAYRIE